MDNKFKNNKLNKGFTLIEVLVAVIILSIVCIPIFRAMVTSFNTTAKSKYKMVATNAAENIMEDMKSMTLKDVVTKYGNEAAAVYGNPNKPGKNMPDGSEKVAYELTLTEASKGDLHFNKDLQDALDGGYKVNISIDPSYYKNSNNRNLSEYNTVSADTAAIFSMNKNDDLLACDKFVEYNENYWLAHPEMKKDRAPNNNLYFLQNVKRLIQVNIEQIKGKNGGKTFTIEGDDTEYPYVSVSVSVTYLFPHSLNEDLFAEDFETYKAVSRQLFDNSVSEEKFSAVFLMYEPRYQTESSNKNNDIIVIKNHDDIEASLYVVAQDSNNTEFEDYSQGKNGKGLILEIYEDEVADKEKPDESKQPLKLFTNLIDDEKVEKYKDTANTNTGENRQASIRALLSVEKSSADPIGTDSIFNDSLYNKLVNKKGSFMDASVAYKLKASTLDGMTGDASSIDGRIYDVKVEVYKETNSDEWPVSVTLTGTMLDNN